MQDNAYQVDDWQHEELPLAVESDEPYPFKATLFRCEFFLNTVAVEYQKQSLIIWELDTIANVGGFIVSAIIFCGIPCIYIQNKLYEAHIMRDSYRMKFNMIMQGFKDDKYNPKKQKKSEKEKKEFNNIDDVPMNQDLQ